MKIKPEPGDAWGILGGTFDPVHHGHIQLARDIRAAKKLTGIFCVPSYNHPFKSDRQLSSYADRLAMLQIALQEEQDCYVSEIEKEKRLSGYTVDTVKALKKRFPDVTFCFLIGADNISELKSWKTPEVITREVRVIAGNRPGSSLSLPEEINIPVELVESGMVPVSSTELRQMLKEQKYSEAEQYLNKDVLRYIRDKGLYL